ncbi:MAG TPA: 8-amino-7-oxononanoate synthase [Gemmatimonadaceae bacterium]|nr:8-amino-7-oxononanoate synthase [Gemmatimonadaceae bacterium]
MGCVIDPAAGLLAVDQIRRTPFRDQYADLVALGRRTRLRSLRERSGIDFASNDYLALASAPRLLDAVGRSIERGVPLGSGGSRLLRGNDHEHEALEAEAAAFFGSEAALYFSTGYAANAALLSTLPQRGDLIVHDALVHASAHEGMRLGRASAIAAAHNDSQDFDDAIVAWRRSGGTGQPWIAVESLYSMDGDRAPLGDLAAIVSRHDAVLLIDEAHATGVFGPDGRGLAADLEGRDNVITLRTCGKALGCEGALVCGPRVVRDFLINRGRGFIFSTAPSPLMASAVREGLRILADEPERRARLQSLVAVAERVLAPHGVVATGSQILPLVLGDDARTMRVAGALQSAGFDVRGIRPPTVPAGTSRLRISLTLNATMQDVEALADALTDALR